MGGLCGWSKTLVHLLVTTSKARSQNLAGERKLTIRKRTNNESERLLEKPMMQLGWHAPVENKISFFCGLSTARA